jgi:hypothetical protein
MIILASITGIMAFTLTAIILKQKRQPKKAVVLVKK